MLQINTVYNDGTYNSYGQPLLPLKQTLKLKTLELSAAVSCFIYQM